MGCKCVDNDPLTFDVYLDAVNPPTTKVSENQTLKTFDVSLESSKVYYWKVVSEDDKGGLQLVKYGVLKQIKKSFKIDLLF